MVDVRTLLVHFGGKMVEEPRKMAFCQTMGKRILVERLQNPNARNVCFKKRCQGLFKKAVELSRLHPNLHIAAVAFSPAATTPFEFGNTSLLFNHYISAAHRNPSPPPPPPSRPLDSTTTTINAHNRSRTSEIKALLNVHFSKLILSDLNTYLLNLEKLRYDLLISLEQNRNDDSKQEETTEGTGEIRSDDSELTIEERLSEFEEDALPRMKNLKKW